MKANVAFDDLVHESVDRASGGGDQPEDARSFIFRADGFFNRFHLAADAPYSRE